MYLFWGYCKKYMTESSHLCHSKRCWNTEKENNLTSWMQTCFWKDPLFFLEYEDRLITWQTGLSSTKRLCVTGQQRDWSSERHCGLGEGTTGQPSHRRPMTSQRLSLLTHDPQDLRTEGEHRGGPSSTPHCLQLIRKPLTHSLTKAGCQAKLEF